jgi:hypothetical protein
MALDRVSIHAPTLAALLQSALTGERYCDGLLLGSVAAATRVQADDAAEAVAVEERTGLIAGSLACCSTGSFYDSTGAIDGVCV